MIKQLLILSAALALGHAASGQVNEKGKVQIGLGLDLGIHKTRFDHQVTVLGFTKKEGKNDEAATVTTPVDVQYGLSDRFSLGLHFEPGRYLDSAGTNPNKLILLGLSPRFYALNNEHFGLYVHADLGVSKLDINTFRNGRKEYLDKYDGGHFRLGVGGQYFFGGAFGLHAGLRLVAADFKWKGRDPQDPVLDALNYDASLKTNGVQVEVGLQVRL